MRLVPADSPVSLHPLNRGLSAWWLHLPGRNLGYRNQHLPGCPAAPVASLEADGPGTALPSKGRGQAPPGRWGSWDLGNSATSDRVNVPSGFTNLLKNQNVHTVSMWVMARTFTGSPVILSQGANNTNFFMEFTTTGYLYWGHSGSFRTYSTGQCTVGQWAHLVFSRTASGNSGDLYVNGTLAPTYSGTFGDTLNLDHDLWVGNFNNTGLGLDGCIDDVRVYGTRALDASEAYQLYREGLRGYPRLLNWGRRRPLVSVPAGGTVTGTAALSTEAATTAGTGYLGVNATSALTAEVATLAGTGALTNSYTATASLAAEVATLAATGNYAELDTVSGTGAVTTEVATLAGTGYLGVNATSALTTEVATLAGTGTHTAPTFSATAALTAEVATLAGTGTASPPDGVTATAALSTEAATLAATGVLTNAYTATAALSTEAATLSATGTFTGVAPDFVAGDVPTWKASDPGATWRLDDPGNTWRGRGETDVEYARLEKRDDWSRNYNFSFEEFAEVEASQTLSDPTVTFTPSGLTVGTPAVSGGVVQVRISGGTAGVRYTGECVVTTSGGDTLSQQGGLEVVA